MTTIVVESIYFATNKHKRKEFPALRVAGGPADRALLRAVSSSLRSFLSAGTITLRPTLNPEFASGRKDRAAASLCMFAYHAFVVWPASLEVHNFENENYQIRVSVSCTESFREALHGWRVHVIRGRRALDPKTLRKIVVLLPPFAFVTFSCQSLGHDQ